MTASAHPRRLELERLAMGEPSAAQDHVAGCADCTATVAQLRGEARAFVARRPTQAFLENLDRRREPRWKRWWPALGLVPLAAGLALVVLGREPEVRLKGGGLQLFVTRAERTWPLSGAEPAHPGDRLTFVFDSPREGHLLVLDVEQGQAPTAFFPFGGATSAPVSSGRIALPDAVVLDDTRADEWLVTIFSPRALSLAEVAATLDGGVPGYGCEGCTVEVRVLTREPR